jgi:Leucine-rich repeat (LRR) protein
MTIIKILLVCCLALSSIQSSWASYPQCLVDCTLCNQSQVGEQLNGTIIAYPGRESLDLTGKELQYLPDETWNNPALESLILDYNQLVEFDPDLGYFWNLKYLSMVGNKISKSIPPEIGALWQLYELDLSYNFLTNLPQEIKYMHNLAVLRAGGNQLTGLPDELTLCSNLEVLQLNHNQLKALPASIGKCNK